MIIEKKLIRYNYSSRNGQAILYIVIHDTGNKSKGANAEMHYKYFDMQKRKASAHYFVDDTKIIQTVEETNAAWHVGDGKGKYGITNQNSIGVEICVNEDSDYSKAVENAIQLTKYLMQKHSISLERVVRHFDASRKICPASMSADNWEEWKKFKNRIAEKELTSEMAIQRLIEKGIILNREYWIEQIKHVRHLDTLLIKIVKEFIK
mgnify:CR=1 FL=1